MPQYIVLPAINISDGHRANGPANCDPQYGIVTRFAPSPNGLLHWGHAYAAICAHDFARAHGGRFLLRIEDIDAGRSRQEYTQSILTDVKWLGLHWDGEAIMQSARIHTYRAALDRLIAMGLAYRCGCTRGEIDRAVRGSPVRHGPDGPVYPGTCRGQMVDEHRPFCWRLDMHAATEYSAKSAPKHIGESMVQWTDLVAGKQTADPSRFGDIVLWRKDAPASYHLAATLDDHNDGITHVVRGHDLFAYTDIHILLQKLLGLLHPVYWHHDLLLDEKGEKLSKSRGSTAISLRRMAGDMGADWTAMLRSGQLPLGISMAYA